MCVCVCVCGGGGDGGGGGGGGVDAPQPPLLRRVCFYRTFQGNCFFTDKAFREVQTYSTIVPIKGSTKDDLKDFKIEFQFKHVLLLQKASQ